MVYYCEVHRSERSFCLVHRLVCCAVCHSTTFSGCDVRKLSSAIDNFKDDIRRVEPDVKNLLADLGSIPDADTCPDNEKTAIRDVSKFVSDVKNIVNECEQKATKDVKKKFSKNIDARKQYGGGISFLRDRINHVMTEISDANILDTRATQSVPRVHEGAAAVNIASRDDVSAADSAKLVDKLSVLSIEMQQLLSTGKDQVTRFHHISAEIPTIKLKIDNGSVGSLRKMLNKACTLVDELSEKPTKSITENRFSVGKTDSYPIMRFVDETLTSSLVVGTCNPPKLSLIRQNGVSLHSITLSSDPEDVCVIKKTLYATQPRKNRITVHNLDNLKKIKSIRVTGHCRGIDHIVDNLVVVCRNDKCVRVISDSGAVLSTSTHKFSYPQFVTVSSSDIVCVSDHGRESVVILSRDMRTTLREIKHPELTVPRGVCLITADRLLVCSWINACVLELNVDGSGGRKVISGDISWPLGICYQRIGRRLAVSNSHGDVVIYTLIP